MKFSTIALLFVGFAAVEAVRIDATAEIQKPCVYLDETQGELDYQIDMFSRTLDERHWTNAMNIKKALGKKGAEGKFYVHTWELMDKAFSFPRVRRYAMVQENMDMLEHFQDNLNQNQSNNQNMANFLRVARTVRDNFNAKYHDGEFDDPGNHDARAEAEAAAAAAAKRAPASYTAKQVGVGEW